MAQHNHIRGAASARALGVLAVSTCLVAVSIADYKGTYRCNFDVRGGRSDGKLEYKLELGDRGDARLTVRRSGSIGSDSDSRQDYGDILRYFDRDDTITQTGNWREADGGIWVRFDRIKHGGNEDRTDSYFRFRDDRGNLRVREYSEGFFGDRPDFRFEKGPDGGGSKNNDLLTGLAVLAVGALVIASTQNHGVAQEYGYTMTADGTLRFGDNDSDQVRSAKFDLKKDNKFTVDLKGSFPVQLKGTWEKQRNGYRLKISEMTVDGDRRDASGNGSIDFDSDGRSVKRFSFDSDVSSRKRNARLTLSKDWN
ncbi:hypothetical protein EON79_10410 [bacterium]|nr:MAG: hypothetical protein EON79_10410 [bacterium]